MQPSAEAVLHVRSELFCREKTMTSRMWPFLALVGLMFLSNVSDGASDAPAEPKATDAPATLVVAKVLYRAQAEDTRKKYEAEQVSWSIEYRGELTKLEDAFAKEGNLKGLLAVQAEAKRFVQDKTIGAEALVSEPGALAQVQQKYRTMCEEAEDRRDKRMERLSKDYVSWMKDIRKSLTREKKLEDARAIDAELERVEEGGDPVEAAAAGEPELAEKAFFAAVGDLDGARKIYSDKVAESTEQAGRDIKKWPAEYSAGLQKLEVELLKDGDLNGVKAVQEEAKRFKLDETIDGGTIVGEPEKLAELQQQYATARGDALGKHDERVERLKHAYVGRLREIQKKLTMEKKISDAINVGNEIKRIGEAYAPPVQARNRDRRPRKQPIALPR